MVKTGRPTKYSKELVYRICAEISEGKSMRTICAADDMPALSTIFLWLDTYEEFSDQYAKAKLEQAEAMVEDMLFFADDKETEPARSRLQVDTRKWIASKLKAKKYGDKIDMTSGGEKIGSILQTLQPVAKDTLPEDKTFDTIDDS